MLNFSDTVYVDSSCDSIDRRSMVLGDSQFLTYETNIYIYIYI